MAEYISKADLMDHIEEEARRWGLDYDYEQILGDIEDFPPATVRPTVPGKWEEQYLLDDYIVYICSACGETWALDDGTPEENGMNFCPRCGATMQGDTK